MIVLLVFAWKRPVAGFIALVNQNSEIRLPGATKPQAAR
jgi:hypothetical protein